MKKYNDMDRRKRHGRTIDSVLKDRIIRTPNLPTNFIGWLHGFLDGDGYLGHTKSKNNIKWELNFNLSYRDKALLEYIAKMLQVGIVKEIK